MKTAADYAIELLTVERPSDAGWQRDGVDWDTVAIETITRENGRRESMYVCPACDTPWPVKSAIQTCHVVPAREIQKAIRVLAETMGHGKADIDRLIGQARDYHAPGNGVTGCPKCNGSHEIT